MEILGEKKSEGSMWVFFLMLSPLQGGYWGQRPESGVVMSMVSVNLFGACLVMEGPCLHTGLGLYQ